MVPQCIPDSRGQGRKSVDRPAGDSPVGVTEIAKSEDPGGSTFGALVILFSARTRERMEELVKGDTVMEKAMTTLEFLRKDRQTRMLYEERQKGLHDYVSAIEEAMEKGKLEGRLEGNLNMARKLLARGVGIEIIEEVSGLVREQIEALQQDLH